VAIGGKAAMQSYSDDSALVYCMSPGTYLKPSDHGGVTVQISMMPRPSTVIGKMKEFQPNLDHVAVLWSSLSYASYLDDLRKVGTAQGILILGDRLPNVEALPDRLRSWKGHAHALLMTSDPLLINDENLVIMRQFSWSNQLPLYCAIGGLANKGATASFSVGYHDIGATTAEVVKQLLDGKSVDPITYSDKIVTEVDLGAAAKTGIALKKDLINNASKVIP